MSEKSENAALQRSREQKNLNTDSRECGFYYDAYKFSHDSPKKIPGNVETEKDFPKHIKY